LWKKFTAALTTRFNIPIKDIQAIIPDGLQVIEYGRMRRTDGGDRMQAYELVRRSGDSRDMTYVRVSNTFSPLATALNTNLPSVPAACRHFCRQEKGEAHI
jgi:hypothetical protein